MYQKYKHQFHYNPLSVLHHIAGTHHDFAIEAAKIHLLTVDNMCLDIEQSLLSMNAHGNNTTICSPACYTQIHKTENLQWSMCTIRLDLWPYETAWCYGRKFTCSRHWQHKFHQTSNMVHSHAAHVPLLAPLSPKLLGLHFAHAFRMMIYVMLSATNPSHCMPLNTLM